MSVAVHGIVKANKSLAERALGRAPGRPTFSRRAGRRMSTATGWRENPCVDLFHVFLIAAGVALLTAIVVAQKPKGESDALDVH